VLDKIKSFFKQSKAESKAEQPKPAVEVAEKRAPEAPEKKGSESSQQGIGTS
jgi:hypothetical protein